MPEPIGLDEVVRELRASETRETDGAPGWTTAEIAGALRLSERSGRERVRAWVMAGSLVHSGWRRVPNVCGGMQRVPVYRRP